MGTIDSLKVYGLFFVAAIVVLKVLGVYSALGVTVPGMLGLITKYPRPVAAIVIIIAVFVLADRIQS